MCCHPLPAVAPTSSLPGRLTPRRLFTLTQTGRVRLDARGGWKAVTAVQRACPLEPALVWSATASLAPLISLSGAWRARGVRACTHQRELCS